MSESKVILVTGASSGFGGWIKRLPRYWLRLVGSTC
jgi:short-subunit dehydrogenase